MRRLTNNTFKTLLTVLLFSTGAFAQLDDLTLPKWKLADIGIRISTVNQDLKGVDRSDIFDLVKDKEQFQVDMSEFQEASSTPYFQAGRLGAYVSLSRPMRSSGFTSEWHLGLNATLSSEILVDFENMTDPRADDNYMGWCLMNNRIGLEVDRMVRYTKNKFSLVGGLGGSLSTSFNDEVLIIRERGSLNAESTTKAASTQFMTFKGSLGASYQFAKALSVDMTFSYGYGWHARGFKAKHTNNKASGLALGLRYSL